MDTRRDHRFERASYRSWCLEKSSVIKSHSDGGVRGPGIAAAAFTISVLRVSRNGDLSRTLLYARSVFMSDECVTAPAAERVALTMAMRDMAIFTSCVAPAILN